MNNKIYVIEIKNPTWILYGGFYFHFKKTALEELKKLRKWVPKSRGCFRLVEYEKTK